MKERAIGKNLIKARYILCVAIVGLFLSGCSEDAEINRFTENYYSQHVLLVQDNSVSIEAMWVEDEEVYVAQRKANSTEMPMIYKVVDGQLVPEEAWNKALTAFGKEKGMSDYSIVYGRNRQLYVGTHLFEGWISEIYHLSDYGSSKKVVSCDEDMVNKFNVTISDRIHVYSNKDNVIRVYNPVLSGYRVYTGKAINWAAGYSRIYTAFSNYIVAWTYSGYRMGKLDTKIISAFDFMDVDEMDNLYVVNEDGIYCLAYGSSIWEILIDESSGWYDGEQYLLEDVYIHENEFLLLLYDKKEKNTRIVEYRVNAGRNE